MCSLIVECVVVTVSKLYHVSLQFTSKLLQVIGIQLGLCACGELQFQLINEFKFCFSADFNNGRDNIF